MSRTHQPTRQEFASYWKDYDTFAWRQLVPYAVYLGGLALYAFAVRRTDAEGRFLVIELAGAAGYLIFLPYFCIRWVRTRKSQFIRCPDCGDWFGQDFSGAYHGPNPKFKSVIETGRCSKCGKQILAE
jgi:DNA-directed RNA polymerase subunit RPC12/RpoP